MRPPRSTGSEPTGAFSREIAAYQGRLRAFIVSLVLDPDVADDVLQQTNLVLCRKADRFEPGTSFRAWAFRVAYGEVQNRRRVAGRDLLVLDERLVEQVEDVSGEEDAEYERRHRRLRACLAELRGPQRRLFVDRYLTGKAVKELAAERQRTPNAISLVLFRVREKLMECVAELEAASGSPAKSSWRKGPADA